MEKTFPDGMGGVVAFGKLPALVQGSTLSIFGWSLNTTIFISTAFVLLSLFFFADVCRRLGHSASFTFCYIALLGLTEPFVAAAQRGRFEFLTIIMLSLSLWLATRMKIIFSIFIAALAAEFEPIAIVVLFAVIIFVICLEVQLEHPRFSRLAIRIVVGTFAGGAVYFFLHPHIWHVLQTANWGALKKGSIRLPGGFVTAYYVVYRRHLPELALLLAAIGDCIFAKKHNLLLQWPALCIGTIFVLATCLRWPNPAYFALVSPFICFFILQVFYSDRRRNMIIATILLFTISQYLYRYKLWSPRRQSFSAHDQEEINAAITQTAALLGKGPGQLNIVGDYAVWFAHPDHFINLNREIGEPGLLSRADLILCFDRPINPGGVTEEMICSDLKQADTKLLSVLSIHSNQLRLLMPNGTQH